VLFAPIGFTWLGLTGSAIRPTRHQLGPGRTRQGPGPGPEDHRVLPHPRDATGFV